MEMEPFGSDNPYPVFLCRDLNITNKMILKDKHLKLKLENNIDAIGFNMSEMEAYSDEKIDIVFKPSINEWNGNKQVQYVIVDID
jgi:single-stranded-DNA-specific exonuclease